MTAIDYILDGLEAELALERELGVRSFACDRALLAPLAPPVEVRPAPPAPVPPPARTSVAPPAPPAPVAAPGGPLDFIFLHDRPLSPAGNEMMAKIIGALGKTAESAPIVIAPPMPEARIRIVLGSRALKMWFPGKNAGPGQWFTDEKGGETLVTYTPEYFLRYKAVTPALKQIKQDMWNSLKSVLKRI